MNKLRRYDPSEMLTLVFNSALIDACDATTGWTALGNDTTGLVTDLDHVFGTTSLEFDKVDGAADTTIAAIQKTITSISLSPFVEEGSGIISLSMNLSSLADVANVFIRLGTDASHYNEWVVLDTNLKTGWNEVKFKLSESNSAASTGNGWDSAAVTYVCAGVTFDAEDDTLADIRMDLMRVSYGLQATIGALSAGSDLIGEINSYEKPDATSTYAPSTDDSVAYEASSVIKASAGVLYGLTGYNSKTTAQFIHIFNSATVPSDTAVPVLILRVNGESNISYDSGKFGRYFSTGMSWSNSSTGATKTLGSTDVWLNVDYI